jgi:hypothetical protein
MVVGNTHLHYRKIVERDSATETILLPTKASVEVVRKREKCIEVLIRSAYAGVSMLRYFLCRETD